MQCKYPRSLKQAHTAAIWDVQFHPVCTDNIFTCGEDGWLLHWDTNPSRIGGRGAFDLASDPSHMKITNLIGTSSLGVNSLAVGVDHVACGTDNEALLIFSNLSLQ